MKNTDRSVILNHEESMIVSDILKNFSEILNSKHYNVESKTKNIQGEKGEIVTAILISVFSATIYDILKTLIKKFSGRKDFNYSLKIKINEDEFTLEEILNKR